MKVYHGRFGKGEVIASEGGKITVLFEDVTVGERRFVYPDAFGGFLRFEDQAEQQKAEKLLSAKKNLLALSQAKRREEENSRIREQLTSESSKAKRTSPRTRNPKT